MPILSAHMLFFKIDIRSLYLERSEVVYDNRTLGVSEGLARVYVRVDFPAPAAMR
jgi:hypothetical protein